MSLKYIKYKVFNSLIMRFYKLWKEREARIAFFEGHYPQLSKGELRKLIRKSKMAWLRCHMGYGDFFRLHCEDKSMKEIGEYVSVRESSLFCWLVSSIKARKLLDNKFECYKHFSKYYGRRVEMVSANEINNGDGLGKMKKFINDNNQSYIIKPLKLNCGQGIKVMSSIPDITNYIKEIGGGYN